MKAIQRIAGGLLLVSVLGLAACGQPPVYYPRLPVTEIQAYFSEAASTQAIDTAYYEIKDANDHTIGTVLFSSPYSDAVKGFNGPTPLLIALDTEGRIKQVALLDNQETPRFVQRVVNGGFYENWNGLTVAEAIGKEVDAISGATYTSNGVKNSLVARLQAYERQLKEDRTAEKKNFWQRLFSK